MIRKTFMIFALAVLTLSAGLAYAGEMTQGAVFVDDSGVAVKGYDVVSYIEENKAVEGSKANSAELDGVTYYFATAENKEAFTKNPQKYLPQYGGWCAYGVGAANQKFPVDPEVFKVVDGKTYLFFNGETPDGTHLNTINPWNEDESNVMKQADSNWPKLKAGS